MAGHGSRRGYALDKFSNPTESQTPPEASTPPPSNFRDRREECAGKWLRFPASRNRPQPGRVVVTRLIAITCGGAAARPRAATDGEARTGDSGTAPSGLVRP